MPPVILVLRYVTAANPRPGVPDDAAVGLAAGQKNPGVIQEFGKSREKGTFGPASHDDVGIRRLSASLGVRFRVYSIATVAVLNGVIRWNGS